MADGSNNVAIEEVKALVAEADRLKQELMDKLQDRIRPILQNFLKDHPAVKALAWTQYVPYFNDGEECVFFVNDLTYSLVDADERDGSHYGEGWQDVYSHTPCEGVSEETHKALNELDQLIRSDAMEDTLQVIFGSHARVIVTSEGVEVEEYDHD